MCMILLVGKESIFHLFRDLYLLACSILPSTHHVNESVYTYMKRFMGKIIARFMYVLHVYMHVLPPFTHVS